MDSTSPPLDAWGTSILENVPERGQRVWTLRAYPPVFGRQLEVCEFRGLDRRGDALLCFKDKGDIIGCVTHWRRLQ